MNTKKLLDRLNRIANVLDETGYYNEANELTTVMNKVANRLDEEYMDRFDPSNDPDYRTPGRSEMFESDMPGELEFEGESGPDLLDAIMNEIDKVAGTELSKEEMDDMARQIESMVKDRINRLITDQDF